MKHIRILATYAFLLLPLPAPGDCPALAPIFNCSRMSMALLPETFMAFSVSLPRPISSTTFEGSAAPMTGISLASHC